MLAWFKSFLTNRRQRVKVGKTYSEWADVTSGVPQGSVLAPLLFILYVTDMQVDSINAKLTKFADDTKIYSEISDSASSQRLQNSLNKVSEWCDTWKMPINVSKSGVLHFTKQKQNVQTYYSQHELPLDEVPLKILPS